MAFDLLKLNEYKQAWKSDPNGFMKEMLSVELPSHQKSWGQLILEQDDITIKSSNGIGKCVAEDELIVMADGKIVQAGFLVGSEFDILSFKQDSGKQLSKSSQAHDNGLKECFKIVTTSGREIIRTHNHPLLCGHLEKDYSFKDAEGRRLTIQPFKDGWKACKKINVGDLVLVPTVLNTTEVDDENFTEDDAKLLGYLLGDGGTTINVGFTQQEGKVKEDFINIIEKFGCSARKVTSNKYGIEVVKTLEKHNPYIKNEVREKCREWGIFGKKAIDKSIPEFVHSLPLSKLSLIINRLFSCDGYVWENKSQKNGKLYTNYKIGITLASKLMIDQLEILFLRFGINCRKRYKPSKYTGCDKIFDAWELEIAKREDIEKFYHQIGIFGKEEKLQLAYRSCQLLDRKKEQKWQYLNCPQGYKWEKVKLVENVGEKKTVMISVLDTHTFLTTFCEHNSFYWAALALWFLFCYYVNDDDNVIVLITAPTFGQVRENIYNPIRKFIDKIDLKLSEEYEKLPEKLKKQVFPDGPPKFIDKLSEDRKLAEIRVGRTNYILGVSTDSENSNVGKHGTYVLCIFDEAQGIDDKKMSDFRGITTSGLVVKKVMIGNTTLPNGLTGPFYRSFQKGSEWVPDSVSCFDTPNFIKPNIKKEDFLREEKDPLYWRNKLDKYCKTDYYKAKKENKVAQWKLDVKQALMPWSKYLINPIEAHKIFVDNGSSLESYEFRTRCLAEFPPDTDGALFPQDWINLSFANYYDDTKWKRGDITMGVDIAQGTGSDKSAISIRDGNRIIFSETFNLALTPLLDKIEELYNQFNVQCINIETDGVGRDKAILLEERGLNVNYIQVGAGVGVQGSEFIEDKEKQEQLKKDFCGKRDEVWWNLRNLMNPDRRLLEEFSDELPVLLPPKEMLRQELSAMTFKRNDKSKIKVASKDEIKSKISRSPDMCDSIVMAFANSDDFYSGGNLNMISVAPSIQRPRF